MKKPTLRVTKWFGDIPVEAGCSACSGVVFEAKGSSHRPYDGGCVAPSRQFVGLKH
jgi:hypothetical protein